MTLLSSALGLAVPPALAQEESRTWERRTEATQISAAAFHSTQSINLPTVETLSRGEWQFEIGHRFVPAVSDGVDALWGLDGPAYMRLGLGYAPADRFLVTVARSNLMDNWDLQAKVRALDLQAGPFPIQFALQGGAAWSSEVAERDSGDKGNFQYYGQVIVNTAISDRLALGVVPSYLYNVLLDRIDPVQDIFWGVYGQLRLSDLFSFNAEWTFSEDRAELEHDAGALGIELETGGHFFKVFLSNSVRLNPSQYLTGTDFSFEPGEWRLGFAITRILHF